MTVAPIRVYVIDDNPHRLRILTSFLDSEAYLVECYSSGEEFLRSRPEDDVGCLIVNLHLPGLSGAEILRRLKQAGSDLAVIVVADVADIASTVQVMRDGALTVLEAHQPAAALLSEIESGLAQSRAAHARRVQIQTIRERLATLSPEERDILGELIAGTANKVIAQQLAVGVRTVERYRSSVLRKMQAGSVVELARLLSALD